MSVSADHWYVWIMSYSQEKYNLTFGIGLLLACYPLTAAAQTSGFIYVATNDPGGNVILQYNRAGDGSLTKISQSPTGGLGGTGNGVGNLDPLGSQDSLVLSESGSVLVAVNAGSNELSSLSAGTAGVHFLSKVSSGGSFPNSVAVRGSLVYAVNAHGTPN